MQKHSILNRRFPNLLVTTKKKQESEILVGLDEHKSTKDACCQADFDFLGDFLKKHNIASETHLNELLRLNKIDI